MSGADTLRVLNRALEYQQSLEDDLFKASWERMCLLAAIASAQLWTDDYYYPASLDNLVDNGPYRREVREAQLREVKENGMLMPRWLRMEFER